MFRVSLYKIGLCLNAMLLASQVQAATWNVTIQYPNNSPSTLTITQGDTVIFTDSGFHTATSDAPSCEFNLDFRSGPNPQSHTFNTPGTYNYHCIVHSSCGSPNFSCSGSAACSGNMLGTIIVNPAPSPTISPTFSSSPTITDTSSYSATPSITPTFSITETNSPTSSASPSITPSFSPSFTNTITDSFTPTASPTNSPYFSATFSPSVTESSSPTPSATPSSSPSDTSTPSVSPTNSPSPSSTPSVTASFSSTPLLSPTPSSSPTASPSQTPLLNTTPTFTPSSSFTPGPTPVVVNWAGFAYSPSLITIPVGTSITFPGSSFHPFVIQDPAGTGVCLAPNTNPAIAIQFNVLGTYEFHCANHGICSVSSCTNCTAMAGKVFVVASLGSPQPTATSVSTAFPDIDQWGVSPNPAVNHVIQVAYHLLGNSEATQIRLYSPAFMLIGTFNLGPRPAGWNRDSITAPSQSSGIFYLQVVSTRSGQQNKAQSKVVYLLK